MERPPTAPEAQASWTPRFASFAAKGLVLRACMAASGAQAPLELARPSATADVGTAFSGPNARQEKISWKRKSLQWATAGSVGLVLAFAMAQALSPSVSRATEGAAGVSAAADAVAAPGATVDNGVIAAARAQWSWAREHGFYKADSEPKIADFGHRARGAEDAACALYKIETSFWGGAPRLSANIQISPEAAGMGLSADDPKIDIEQIILHEGWHVETFVSPELNRFEGSLLRGDAADLMKMVVWADSILAYAGDKVAARHKAERDALASTGANPALIYQEASADSFSYITLAHTLSKEEWDRRILRTDGARITSMIVGDASVDSHETQESLQILAALGRDQLAALSPEQSRALTDAVAADGVALAAAKQGWSKKIEQLAPIAAGAPEWGDAGFSDEQKALGKVFFAQLRPSVDRWRALPQARREAAFAALAEAAGAWEKGARIDYSSIAPGLVAQLTERPAGPGYEAPSRPSDFAARTRRLKEGLTEWRQTAESLGERNGAVLKGDRFFDWVAEQLPNSEKDALGKDAFWGPTINGFDARLAAKRAQQANPEPGQNLPQEQQAAAATTVAVAPPKL
jgi:hypothetical protein